MDLIFHMLKKEELSLSPLTFNCSGEEEGNFPECLKKKEKLVMNVALKKLL